MKGKKLTRIDVIQTLEKIQECLLHSEGATVKEICHKVNCTPRTFYRYIQKFKNLGITVSTKQDRDLLTSGKRYFIKSEKKEKLISVNLTSSEKLVLEDLLKIRNFRTESEQRLHEKLLNAFTTGGNQENGKNN